MARTRLTADLSAFAGQTVRLRIANSVTEGPFNTGLDDVSVTSVPLPPAVQPVHSRQRKKVKRAQLVVTAAGIVRLPLKPNSAGKKILNAKGKLKTRIDVTFTPTGGFAATQTYKKSR